MQPLDRSIPPSQKAIPPARDRLQSRLVVGIITPLLLASAVEYITPAIQLGAGDPRFRYFLMSVGVSTTFASLAVLARTATLPAAASGGLICVILINASYVQPPDLLWSPFLSLMLLFVLTSLATRFRRRKKEALGTAEARTGRSASQVVANLGTAALFAACPHWRWHLMTVAASYTAIIASLAEATADTLSSEIGQGISSPAFLITNFRRVPAGTDGAVSIVGTVAGVAGAIAIGFVAVPPLFSRLTPFIFAVIVLAAVAGLFFDSFLGATLERRGWLGNDLVNFFSTAFAAAVSYPLMLLALHFLRL